MDPFSPYWISIYTIAGYNAIIATGLYLSCSAGAFSVAHAALAGFGAYTSALLTIHLGFPFWAGVLVGVGVGWLAGAVLALITARMSLLVSSITTLAFGSMVGVVVLNTPLLGGALSLTGIPPATDLSIVIVCLGGVLFATWRFTRSRLGLAAASVRDNPAAASAIGISVGRTRFLVFAVGAAVAALGGALRGHYVLALNAYDLGFWISVSFQIFWIFGGSYSFLGAALGAVVLTIAPELLRFSSRERLMLYGLLLTALVLVRPEGLLPRRLGLPTRKGRAARSAEAP